MKFNSPIEVSGIRRIVINRKLVFVRVDNGPDWYLLDGNGDPHVNGATWKRTADEMKYFVDKTLNKLKPSKKYKGCFTWVNRTWVHEDTLNIVRRDAE